MPAHEASNVLRARLNPRRLAIELAWTALAVIVLTLLAPFGILSNADWGTRLVYWARTLMLGYVLYRPMIRLGAGCGRRLALPEWAGWVAALVAAAPLMSFWLWVFGPDIDFARAPPQMGLFVETAGQVLLISLLVAGCLWISAPLLGRSRSKATFPVDSEIGGPAMRPDVGPLLAARLPVQLGTEVWALQGEDHYVRVHTSAGDDLLLVRMRDAVADLVGRTDGIQVHRSWWVARSGVAGRESKGRQLVLRLRNGVSVPVARDRLSTVREWLTQTGG